MSRQLRIRGRENHIDLMKELFVTLNEPHTDWQWDFQTDDGAIFSHFSFSKQSTVNSFIGLAGCKISSLDLSYIDNIYLSDLVFSFVKKLNVYGSKLHGLQNIKRIKGLEEIIVKKGQLTEEEKAKLSFVKITELD